jgi:hypothetical protein
VILDASEREAGMKPSTVKRRNLGLARRLGLDLSPQPRGRWEGVFLHTTSSPNESYFMRASIGMTAGAFEGEACISPDAKDDRFIEADLCGGIEGREVSFTVWVRTEQRPEPFACTARINARTNLIRGTWRHPCYQGEACSCEGGGGIFELRRVRD